ncbi:MAG TPA: hypothetical protein VJM32_05665 [Candidatus Saccharimonadales bacterium]|nr:hypothetical protein [Candidatus Saccharimonadales bacterium]
MTFNKRLPTIRTLRYLADMDGPFPIKNRHIILAAQRFWFGDNVIEFLKLFPPDAVFHSRDGFIERCKQLELLIQEERHAPLEVLHSPQG